MHGLVYKIDEKPCVIGRYFSDLQWPIPKAEYYKPSVNCLGFQSFPGKEVSGNLMMDNGFGNCNLLTFWCFLSHYCLSRLFLTFFAIVIENE